MARAHYLAALLALDAGERATAEKALTTAVSLNKLHAPAWAQLARLYVMNGEFVKAEGCLENAVANVRDNPATHDLIGTAFRLGGNLDAARLWHAKAVEIAPGHVPFLINLANVHLYFGDLTAAEALLDRCIEVQPDNALVHWLLSRTAKTQNVWHIEAMQDLVAEQRNPRSLAYLHYAIGKEAEDLEEWQLAFDAFEAGAKARRETVAFDEENEIAVFAAAKDVFTSDWLAGREPGPVDAAPIFIVGEPRSGTTLLDRMLSGHSRVHSAGELRHLGFAVRKVIGTDEPRQFTPELIRAAAEGDAVEIGAAYLDSTASLRGDAAHLIDKLPNNYLYLPLILAALPKAKVVHMRRDPMDACFAMFKQLFADAYLYSYDQQELARHFVRYWELMQTWRERFPKRFLDVDYEDLVSEPEETLRTVLEHVGLSWQAQCLEFEDDPSAVTTASAAQVREKPHRRSIGRWRRYQQHLRPMQEVLSAAGLF